MEFCEEQLGGDVLSTDLLANFLYVNSCPPDHSERFAFMMENEETYAIRPYQGVQVDGFTNTWRKRIVEWLYQGKDTTGWG